MHPMVMKFGEVYCQGFMCIRCEFEDQRVKIAEGFFFFFVFSYEEEGYIFFVFMFEIALFNIYKTKKRSSKKIEN